ncbi:hypothetical protein N9H39_11720 [Gammaproteobacteria bacterium]|nr:hypothetical protein [Gammaproteobacteria bacterium]
MKFQNFDEQLRERLETFKQFEINIEESKNQNSEREGTIDELIDKSDSMIKGATVAGLSSKL